MGRRGVEEILAAVVVVGEEEEGVVRGSLRQFCEEASLVRLNRE